MAAASTRKGRAEARKEARARLVRLHVLVVVLALAGLSLPRALATPDRSDEVALLVCVLWAILWLRPAARAGERARAGSPPYRLRLWRTLRSAACVVLGLGLYWSSLLLPPAGRARLAVSPETRPRPSVIVTNADNPFFVARVVRVNDDLSLVVDDGSSLGAPGSPGSAGGAGPTETVCLAGVNGLAVTAEAAEAAVRLLAEEGLGRLVTVRVLCPPAGRSLPAAPALAFVYLGVVDVEATTSGRSLNSEIEALLAPSGTPTGDGAP